MAWKSLRTRNVCCTIVCVYAPPAGRPRRDQQDRPTRPQVIAPEDRFPVDCLTQTWSDRYTGDSDSVGRNADRDQMGLGLVPRHEEVVERTAQPKSLEVVVSGDDRQFRLDDTASHHQRGQSGRQKVGADDDVWAESLDGPSGCRRVDAIP